MYEIIYTIPAVLGTTRHEVQRVRSAFYDYNSDRAPVELPHDAKVIHVQEVKTVGP